MNKNTEMTDKDDGYGHHNRKNIGANIVIILIDIVLTEDNSWIAQ